MSDNIKNLKEYLAISCHSILHPSEPLTHVKVGLYVLIVCNSGVCAALSVISELKPTDLNGAPLFLNQNPSPRMAPWTDGTPLICKAELLQTWTSNDGVVNQNSCRPNVLNLNSYRP